ncbi:MAG TPA: hypothetical protein VFS20_29660 [Longimicrobium sp.]|nr:hypothetical protein [Longimicrobium sp.]
MPARDGVPERRWARVPPPYADSAAWFRVGPITFRGRRGYLAYGKPYVLFPEERVEVGEYRGVRVFAHAEEPTDAFLAVIFLPMSQGCEFQGYNYLENSGPVRGRQ